MASIVIKNTSLAIILTAFAFAIMARGNALAETTWYVDDNAPADFATIQEALDAASDTDTIIVRDGTYIGTGNRDIDFGGKAVHLRSENGPDNCVIDCQGTDAEPHRGFYFHTGEDENSLVDGFTITNGSAYQGGGIYCYNNSSPTITNNTITANTAEHEGGGIDCLLNSSPFITNNTITANTADYGGGISCVASSPTVKNSILWGNSAPTGPEVYLSYWLDNPSTLTVRYSNVAGGQGAAYVEPGCTLDWGPGNIDADPLFADPDNGDYHLKSEFGRWDPTMDGGLGGFRVDEVTSPCPCIDAGNPESDYSNETQRNGGRINMGAYGNTPEASKSRWKVFGDVNDDCTVNVLDLLSVRNELRKSGNCD